MATLILILFFGLVPLYVVVVAIIHFLLKPLKRAFLIMMGKSN